MRESLKRGISKSGNLQNGEFLKAGIFKNFTIFCQKAVSLDCHFFYQPEKIQKSSHKRHALRLSSVGPEPREPGSNSPEPRLQTYLRHPVPTHADACPREVRRRRDACPGPRSVRIRKPRAAGALLSPFVSL